MALPKTPASADARVWFEQALDALEPLPESAATLEQGFEVRMDLAMVLNSLGKPLLARVREAEMFAEKLNDNRRRGLALARICVTHANAGELDEALATGARAVEIAGSLGDLRLRIRTTGASWMRAASRSISVSYSVASANLPSAARLWTSRYRSKIDGVPRISRGARAVISR